MKKSPYEWSLEYNVRPYEPEFWVSNDKEIERSTNYHTLSITEEVFLKDLVLNKHKLNSRPRKIDSFLELRMYGLVIYQLSGIQKGIQYQHAVTEYSERIKEQDTEEYVRWANNWKTSIVLNGGTTNDNLNELGTIQRYFSILQEAGVFVVEFREPDLNNAITAISFIVDERVFDRESYPDFKITPYSWSQTHLPNEATLENWEENNEENRKLWVDKIGGEKNAFLRDFLKDFKLA